MQRPDLSHPGPHEDRMVKSPKPISSGARVDSLLNKYATSPRRNNKKDQKELEIYFESLKHVKGLTKHVSNRVQKVGKGLRLTNTTSEGINLESALRGRIAQVNQSDLTPENVDRWISMPDSFGCLPYVPQGEETAIEVDAIKGLKEGEGITCRMLVQGSLGEIFSMPVYLTSGYTDIGTISVNFKPCEWLTVKIEDLGKYTFIK